MCILTTAHPVDDVRVHSKMATSFLAAGFHVTWVGPETAYFSESRWPDSRIDYRLFKPNERRLDRLRAGGRCADVASALTEVDWWYAPDPDAAMVALHLAKKRGGRVLFDIHETFHGAVLDGWLRGRRLTAIRAVVRRKIARVCRRADLVVGVSESVLRPYIDAQDISLVVRNCAPLWFGASEEAQVSGAPDGMRAMHGKAIASNGTQVILDALSTMGDRADGIKVVMSEPPVRGASSYLDSVRRRINDEQLNNLVVLQPGVPHERMPGKLRECDVGLIAYGRGLGEESLPNRLFEYMAAGLAVLAPTYAFEIKAIIDAEQLGITADFDNPDDVARALSWLHQNNRARQEMARNARQAFVHRHNWDLEFARLIDTMNEFS